MLLSRWPGGHGCLVLATLKLYTADCIQKCPHRVGQRPLAPRSALHIDDCRRRHPFMGSFTGLCLSYEVGCCTPAVYGLTLPLPGLKW